MTQTHMEELDRCVFTTYETCTTTLFSRVIEEIINHYNILSSI